MLIKILIGIGLFIVLALIMLFVLFYKSDLTREELVGKYTNENSEFIDLSVDGDSLLLKIKTIRGTIPESFNQASLFIDEFINGHAWTGT